MRRSRELAPVRESYFTRVEKQLKNMQEEVEKENERYLTMKTPEVDVYGNLRKRKEIVSALVRSSPKAEINQK